MQERQIYLQQPFSFSPRSFFRRLQATGHQKQHLQLDSTSLLSLPPLATGTRTPCTDAASATQLGSPTYSPSWVLVGHLVPSKCDHESRIRPFWPTSNLLVTIFDEKAEKRLRRKSAVPVLVPVPQPGAEVDGAAPVLLTQPLSKLSQVEYSGMWKSKVEFGLAAALTQPLYSQMCPRVSLHCALHAVQCSAVQY